MASYEQNKSSKLWSVRFRITENGSYKQKRLSGYKTKKEAEKSLIDFLTNPINRTTNYSNLKNFRELFEIHKDNMKNRLKESSFYELNKVFDRYILPYFKDKDVSQITKLDILNWQNSLNDKGYSYNYKSKIRRYLFSFYKFLNNYYDINNIVAKVQAFNKPKIKKELNFYTYDEFKEYIKHHDEITFYTFFSLLYFTGLRLGEALALNINDIDLVNNIITINKSITRKVLNQQYLVTSPKNESSYREVLISDQLKIILQNYLSFLNKNKIEGQFLFGQNKPLSHSTLNRKHKEIFQNYNLKKIRIHDFRHSHVSLLINLGANILLIAKRLGHSNTQITLNTYSHLYPNSENELIKKLNII